MNNEIGLLVQDLPQEDADRYIKETKSSFDAKHNIQEIEIDYRFGDTPSQQKRILYKLQSLLCSANFH